MDRKLSQGKTRRRLLKAFIWIASIWAVILIIIQVALSPSVLTRMLNSAAEDYIDGELRFGRASVSVFRHFPNIGVTLDSVSLTYPSERFAQYDSIGPDSRMLRRGCGTDVDTLASFEKFSVAVNAASFIAGSIRIPYIHLSKPRVFAKSYNDSTANWNIFRTASEEIQEDTLEVAESDGLPSIMLGKVIMDNSPLLVYCSKQDSIFAAVKVENLGISRHRSHYDMELHAKTGVSMPAIGRMFVPIDISTGLEFPKDSVPAVTIRKFNAKVAGIPFKADADIRYLTDSLQIQAKASIDDCKVSEVLKYCGKNIWDGAKDLNTDAIISMGADINGFYSLDGSKIPHIDITFNIPEAELTHKGIGLDSRIGADIWAKGGGEEKLYIGIEDFHLDGKALGIFLKGNAEDILGEDPGFDVDGKLSISLDRLRKFIMEQSGYNASGVLSAEVKGKIRKSQLSPYRFANANMAGFIRSDRLRIGSEKDSIGIHIDSLDVTLATVGNKHDTSIAKGTRMIAVVAKLDSTGINYKNSLKLNGKKLSLKAQNDAAILDSKDASPYYPFGGRLEIGRLILTDMDSNRIFLTNSDNVFKISPSREDKAIPVMTLTSDNRAIALKAASNRAFVRNLNIKASATRGDVRRRKMAKKFIDSVAKVYPDIPRDSLFRHLRKMRGPAVTPDWLSEEDFRKSDFEFKLDEAIMKYYREWDFSGDMNIGNLAVVTPYFPIRTSVRNFSGHVTNDAVSINRLTVKSGTSEISSAGKLAGMRMALAGRGPLRLNLKVAAERLNANELLSALAKGSQYIADDSSIVHDEIDDDKYQDMIVTDTLENAIPETSMFVVPANLIADISLEAKNVTWSKLQMDWVGTELTMKERCIQIKNTIASTNVGDAQLDGFYSTRTKHDIKTGFDLSLSNITAEKVIEMLPAIDSIMPMLKSFQGLLNCQIAATAQLDTCMNIVMPSLNGVVRVGGKNLGLKETESLYKILKLLKFKDTKSIHIDEMSVEGMIADNRIEIFPFVLAIDRYTLAMSGIQNMDQTFKYHISILKSPLLVRFGVNLWGDFDNFKFKIGKARYKSAQVPIFSSVIDETRLNLNKTIKNIFSKGVNQAIRENENQAAIKELKEKINYENAAEAPIEELSAEENRKLEQESAEGSEAKDGGSEGDGAKEGNTDE
ncbi:MAG: hypothetical protein NC115_05955 [Bacteroidales bacterium]|nr:hypothetical protein [Bacteroidales bacterium]